MSGTTIEAVMGEVVLAQATDLARTGRHGDAERVLAELAGKASPAVLDLRARIRAQTGRLVEADADWARAAELGPAAGAYACGRRRVASDLAGRSRRFGDPAAVAVAVALVLILLAAALRIAASSEDGDPTLRRELAGQAAAARADNDRLSAQLERVERAIQPLATTVPPRPPPPPDVVGTVADEVGLPGVVTRRSGSSLELTFVSGLFVDSDALTPEGGQLLGELGSKLAPFADRVSLAVVGHTDDLPLRAGDRHRDNAELGMVRAGLAARALRTGGNLPSSMFTVSSLGGQFPPFVNDSAAGRAANRTVTIAISAR